MKHKLNLKNPKTLNEKIQWLKLYDRSNLHTICSDKILVRDFVAKNIDKDVLIPLILTTSEFKNIKIESLPDFPFIIKTNHDSGCYAIIKNKSEADWIYLKDKFEKALKKNYYYYGKEWQYKNIKPNIIIEKLLLQENGEIPFDYKFHCFNGKVEMISVDTNRGTKNHYRNWYDKNWNKLPFSWSSFFPNGHKTIPGEEITQPVVLNKLIEFSEILSSYFIYVRVDWYVLNNVIYFGEMTFHHDSGFRPIEPYKWDLILGNKLILKNNKSIKWK